MKAEQNESKNMKQPKFALVFAEKDGADQAWEAFMTNIRRQKDRPGISVIGEKSCIFIIPMESGLEFLSLALGATPRVKTRVWFLRNAPAWAQNALAAPEIAGQTAPA
jgi:hypothetical protein